MKLSAKFAREAILNRNGLNHLRIEVIPPALEQTTKHKPVLMVLVLDRSGSMGGVAAASEGSQQREVSCKMDYTTSAATRFITLLRDDDLFGVVSFDDMAVVDQPLTTISQSTIQGVIANIKSIRPRGCTNISDALLTAKKLITPEHIEKYNCRIVLLSDGEANRGIAHLDGLSSISLNCLKQGITISSLGIGLKYNSAIMGGIAESGGGLFHHVEDLSKLEEIFIEELNLSSIVTAKNVKLLLSVPDQIEIGENLNGYPQHRNGNNIEIMVGDMYNARRVLIEVRNDLVEKDVNFNLAVEYKSLDGRDHRIEAVAPLKVVTTELELKDAKENKDVIDLVIGLIRNRTIRTTSSMYDDGNLTGVDTTFTQSSRMFNNLFSCYCVVDKGIQTELDDLKDLYSNGKASRSLAKELFADSSRKVKD
jgi:Ca-activated chloride channel homolog